MAIPKFEEDMNILGKLGDYPRTENGLETQAFKEKFDEAGLLIKEYINKVLIPSLEKDIAEGVLLEKIAEALNGKLSLTGGTMEGPINMNGQKLSGLNAPTVETEPVTKGYAEDTFATLEYADSRNPPNHIDNSDFTQWVNQAGFGSSHAGSVEKYAGDRWILDSGTVTGEANANGNGYSNIQLNGTIRQIIANPPEAGSVFVEMISGTATAVYEDGEVTVTSAGGVIKSVALYAGVYTDENKPTHQPKGYWAELAECQGYFFRVVGANICGIGTATRAVLVYFLPVNMRGEAGINPTVAVTSALWVYTPSGAVKGTFSHVSANANMLLITVTCTLSGNTVAVVPDFSAYISKDL